MVQIDSNTCRFSRNNGRNRPALWGGSTEGRARTAIRSGQRSPSLRISAVSWEIWTTCKSIVVLYPRKIYIKCGFGGLHRPCKHVKNGSKSHERTNRQQKEKARQSSDYQSFSSVGVTGISPMFLRLIQNIPKIGLECRLNGYFTFRPHKIKEEKVYINKKITETKAETQRIYNYISLSYFLIRFRYG